MSIVYQEKLFNPYRDFMVRWKKYQFLVKTVSRQALDILIIWRQSMWTELNETVLSDVRNGLDFFLGNNVRKQWIVYINVRRKTWGSCVVCITDGLLYIYIYSVCIPRDFDVTNATADRNIWLRFRSKNKGNFFISSSFLMKHGADYDAYRALSPVFQRSLISGLVS